MATTALHDILEDSARRDPERTAVEESTADRASITYAELTRLSDRVRDRLHRLGVGAGQRVGVYQRKSIDGVASFFGILKTGSAYVPVDPSAPPARNAYIFNNCSVAAVIAERRFEERLRAEMSALGPVPPLLLLDDVGGGRGLAAALQREDHRDPAPSTQTVTPDRDDLAYILYTSGSTGKPKGVMLSHHNAVSFVDWCSEIFQPHASDRCSSHAPFHFDLSILDIYMSLKHGATLVVIGEEIGKDPQGLAQLIAERRLTVWYSAPSILAFLAQYGGLGQRDLSALRMILFAGEVFAVKHLRTLQRFVPHARYFNLYGPTETNVCTYYEVPGMVPEERTEPYPIGRRCSHLQTQVVDPDGVVVAQGAEGELCVAGAGVMQGYWNLPENTARGFLTDAEGRRWYRTGDIVVEAPDGNYTFFGRRDRMVKRRGYRVELGEIEAGLYKHSLVREAAVVAVPDTESGVRIKAYLSCREGKRPSLIALKTFCAENLPAYMIPDVFAFVDALPKTSTDKVDYQRLKETA
ncbi:MAG TPA: amino acid adenylation domain-containing protein [Burkholderiales bacterium]|nr:amino acid adenylation domain-containing protein [Burkholderiales bacterium]